MTFRANANGTATLSGTPTVAGTTSLTFTATNSAGSTTQAFTLTVNASARPSSQSRDLDGDRRHAVFLQGHHSGTPVPTITKTGSLPSGVTFTASSDGTATIAGTPAEGWNGNYFLTITARNSLGSVQQSFVLTVGQALAITSANTKTFTAGTASSFTIRATGTPAPTVSVSGSLPAGITFTTNANGTATLAGTAAPGTGGTYPLTIRATNSQGTVTQAFTLTVAPGADLHQPVVVHGWALGEPQLRHHDQWVPGGEAVEDRCVAERADLHCGNRRNGTHQRPHHRLAGTFVLNVTATNAVGTATRSVTVQIT